MRSATPTRPFDVVQTGLTFLVVGVLGRVGIFGILAGPDSQLVDVPQFVACLWYVSLMWAHALVTGLPMLADLGSPALRGAPVTRAIARLWWPWPLAWSLWARPGLYAAGPHLTATHWSMLGVFGLAIQVAASICFARHLDAQRRADAEESAADPGLVPDASVSRLHPAAHPGDGQGRA